MSTRFEPGAPPAGGFVPLSVPEISGNEWSYVKECLETGWVSSVGSYVNTFESNFAKAVGTKYAVATVNGTAAIHTALLAVGVKPDEIVVTSTITFIAPVNAIRYANAWPVVIDAERDSWNLDPLLVVAYLENECEPKNGSLYEKSTGRRVAAILPVHILGHPVDIDPILEVAAKYGIPVVEDATESLGAEYKGRKVGSLGRVSCFSFNGNKLLTTGGGGMIATDDHAIEEKCRYLTTQAKDDPLEYIHGEIGFNYRLTNVLAAIGCGQLERLEEFLATKSRIADRYAEGLGDLSGLQLMPSADWARSAKWLYTVYFGADSGLESRDLLQYLSSQKIQARPLWQPMHQSPAHPYLHKGSYPVAEDLHACCLSLPCSVNLSEEDQSRVIKAIRERIQH